MGLSDYTKIAEIGKGSFGTVILTRCNKDKKKYVVKRIDLSQASKKERKNAMQEADLLSNLDHPNIVAHRESFLSANFLYIVMQYCEGGDLHKRIRKQFKQRRYFHETQVMGWFVQVSLAIQYLHSQNILHRDLKTQNIFLSKRDVVKVGDLGIARVLDSDDDMATTLTGTPYYMSPELFSKIPYNSKSDVWSLGCCMFEVATLRKAFNAKDYDSLAMKVVRGKVCRIPQVFPDEMNSLFHSMLEVEPENRPSVSEMLQLPFVQKHLNRLMDEFSSRKSSKPKERKSSATSVKTSSRQQMSMSPVTVQPSSSHKSSSSSIPPSSSLPSWKMSRSTTQMSSTENARSKWREVKKRQASLKQPVHEQRRDNEDDDDVWELSEEEEVEEEENEEGKNNEGGDNSNSDGRCDGEDDDNEIGLLQQQLGFNSSMVFDSSDVHSQ
eukprot:m.38659 g.38659  ORF g.38659 m.38659 type:complete len:439 (+) comp10233_c0_seq3:78-1394(+)